LDDDSEKVQRVTQPPWLLALALSAAEFILEAVKKKLRIEEGARV